VQALLQHPHLKQVYLSVDVSYDDSQLIQTENTSALLFAVVGGLWLCLRVRVRVRACVYILV
jgi:hypothetical protein